MHAVLLEISNETGITDQSSADCLWAIVEAFRDYDRNDITEVTVSFTVDGDGDSELKRYSTDLNVNHEAFEQIQNYVVGFVRIHGFVIACFEIQAFGGQEHYEEIAFIRKDL